MKILHITGSFPPMICGVGDYTASLAEALGKLRDTKVAVLTDTKARMDSPHLINFELFPVAHEWKFSDLPQILKVVRHWAPDVVHIQYPTQGYGDKWLPWILPLLLALRRIPLVQTWHEHVPMGRRSLLLAIAPSGIIVVRPNYKMVIPAVYRWLIRNKQFQFIPNASAIPRITLSEHERSEIRSRFRVYSKFVVAFFGFIYPHKGVELLFEIADPDRDHILVIGEMESRNSYHQVLMGKANREPWKNKVTIMGFMPPQEVGRFLAASDAVIFPFRTGGGTWNTSVHAAMMQGTFVLITSYQKHGYSVSENVYYARPNDTTDMRQALSTYVGKRNGYTEAGSPISWDEIARSHAAFYRVVVKQG